MKDIGYGVQILNVEGLDIPSVILGDGSMAVGSVHYEKDISGVTFQYIDEPTSVGRDLVAEPVDTFSPIVFQLLFTKSASIDVIIEGLEAAKARLLKIGA